jgi:hypothetical protein
MWRVRCSLLALVALALCDAVIAQAPPAQPLAVCNELEMAKCNATSFSIVYYGAGGDAGCKAVFDFEKCIQNYMPGCSTDIRSVWVTQQTRLQERLNDKFGKDCSDYTSELKEEASSGDSGSTSWTSSGFDGVSSGMYYWQWLLLLVCGGCCICGAIGGLAMSSMMGKGKRGRRQQEYDDDEDEDEEEYDDDEEAQMSPLQTSPQALQMASPATQDIGYTGNALETGALDQANLQSSQTASMTMADPTYMPNAGYAP